MLFFPPRVILLVLSLGHQTMWTCGSSTRNPRWFVERRPAGLVAGQLAAESEFPSEAPFSNRPGCPSLFCASGTMKKYFEIVTIQWLSQRQWWSWGVEKCWHSGKKGEGKVWWGPLITHRAGTCAPCTHAEWWLGCWWSAACFACREVMQMALRDEGFSVEYFLATTSVASPSCEALSSNLWCLGIEGGTSDEEKSLQAQKLLSVTKMSCAEAGWLLKASSSCRTTGDLFRSGASTGKSVKSSAEWHLVWGWASVGGFGFVDSPVEW